MILKTVSIYLIGECYLQDEISLESSTQTCKILRHQDAYEEVKDAIQMFAVHYTDLERRYSVSENLRTLTYEDRVEMLTHEIFNSLQKESGDIGLWAIITNKEFKSKNSIKKYYTQSSKRVRHDGFTRIVTVNKKNDFSASFFEKEDVSTLASILLSVPEPKSIVRLRQSKFLVDEISHNPIYIYSYNFDANAYPVHLISQEEVLGLQTKLASKGTKSISSSFRFFLESRQHKIDNFKSFLFAYLALEELGKQSFKKGWKLPNSEVRGYAHVFRDLVCLRGIDEKKQSFLSAHEVVDSSFWGKNHQSEETWSKKRSENCSEQGFFHIVSPYTRIGIMMFLLNDDFEEFKSDLLILKKLKKIRNELVHQDSFLPTKENCKFISDMFVKYARWHVEFEFLPEQR